jgi:hypothetical protein
MNLMDVNMLYLKILTVRWLTWRIHQAKMTLAQNVLVLLPHQLNVILAIAIAVTVKYLATAW